MERLQKQTVIYKNDTFHGCGHTPDSNTISCFGRCEERAKYKDECSCDQSCMTYSDCCPDYREYCNVSGSSDPNFTRSLQCTDTYLNGERKKILLVSHCAQKWQDKTVQQKCEAPNKKNYDLAEFVPVSVKKIGKQTLVPYVNIYCAVCNFIEEDLISMWATEANCVNSKQLTKLVENKNSSQILQFILFNCELAVTPPNSTDIIPCRIGLVDDCNYALNSIIGNFSSLVASCHSYKAVVARVFTKPGDLDCYYEYFKNEHCALCNGHRNVACNFQSLWDMTERLGSFTILLDFSKGSFGLKSKSKTCDNGEVLVGNKCQGVLCEVGYIYIKNQCSPYADPSSQLQPKGTKRVLISVDAKLRLLQYKNNTHSCLTKPNLAKMTLAFLENILDIPKESIVSFKIIRSSPKNFSSECLEFNAFHSISIRLELKIMKDAPPMFDLIEHLRTVFKEYPYICPDCTIEMKEVMIHFQNFALGDTFQCNKTVGSMTEYSNSELSQEHSDKLDQDLVLVHNTSTYYTPSSILLYAALELNSVGGVSVKIKIHVCEWGISMEDSTCSMVQLQAKDIVVGNATVHIISADITLPRSKVYFRDDIGVFVCHEVLLNYTKQASKDSANTEDSVQRILTLVGSCLSLTALAFTVLTHMLFKSMRNLPNRLLANLATCLFIAQLGQLVVPNQTANQTVCTGLALAMHFFWLASFTWMSIVAFNVWNTFREITIRTRDEEQKQFTLYLAFGYSLPLIVVCVCLVVHVCQCTTLAPVYAANGVCWISNNNFLIFAFMVPIGVSLVFNTIFFLMTTVNVHRTNKYAQKARGESSKGSICEILIYIKLSTAVGLSWVFGFLAVWTGASWLWYPFIVLCTLQGLMLSLAFSFNGRVLALYRRCLRCKGSSLATGSSGTESTKQSSVSHTRSSVHLKADLK